MILQVGDMGYIWTFERNVGILQQVVLSPTSSLYLEARDAEARLRTLWTNPIEMTRGKAWFIPAGKGRRLAISDIHGSFQTFDKLLNKIELTKLDQLFLLGDFIDRGSYSLLVLRKVWQLINEGYQIFPLRGNHEQLMLQLNREKGHKLQYFAARQNAAHLLRQRELHPVIDDFLGILPYYYETDNAFLVHAGFDTKQKDPFRFWKDMLWIRSFDYDAKKLKGKKVIHGHVPVHLNVIQSGIAVGARKIGIDNACVRAGVDGFGRLVCLDIDSGAIYKVRNTDAVPC
jgi:serine/threonine protein phosphatase 1